jgi:predicted ATP-binding protein involved in virulence
MHKDIKNKLHWRTGVVLEAKAFHSTAVIKADERDEKIYIYVDGEQKRDYFTVILFTFRGINRSFEKLKAIEKVPMPSEPEITVSYEHLVRLEKKGIELYIPDGSAREYKVKDLLGTIYVEKKTEEEILEILRKLKDKSDTEETLLQKAEDIAILQPNLGVGVDVKKLVDSIMQRPKLDEQKEIIKLNNPKNIPPDIENIHNRALIFERDGNYREAIREYKKIIDINEFFLMAWQGLERNYRHLGEEETIIDAIDFGTNVEQNIILNQLELYNLDFFDDLIWTFQPQINILLGKNGYGKTYLLKLMVSLLQNDYGVSSVFFSGEKRNAYTKLHLDINNDTKIIQRSKAVFEESIGRVPILAIPDSRFIDKSKITVSYSDSEKGNLREVGSLKFLDERPFEAIIQKFLFYLCVTFMNEGKSFKIPIFPFIQKVVRELSDNEFEFYKIEPIVGELEFKIEVITEGNKDKPLPIQKASQGTLSVLAIFGVIYYYLKSVFQDTPEEELLKKPAIVFIDEVDAHLHPSWQQRIIGLLRKNFPNVQFVVTAHSPLVVAGCYENEVAVLRKGKGGFTVEQCEDSFVGSTTNDLYERIFEIEDIDEKYLYYATLYSMKLDNSDKINELEAKSTLSAAEQEELDRLFKEDYNVSRIAEIKMEEEEKENIYEKEINDLQEEIKGLKSKLKKESRE